TSSRRVSIVNSIESSSSRSRRIRVKDDRISCWVILLLSHDVSLPHDIIREIEEPARRAFVERCLLDFGKAEAGKERSDHAVLGGGNIIRNQSACAACPSQVNRDIHGFEFELPAEHSTAHHPILDLEHVFVIGCGAEDHGTDETVVAHAIEEAKL